MRSLTQSSPSMTRASILFLLILFVAFLKVSDSGCLRSEGPEPSGSLHLRLTSFSEVWSCF